MQNPKPLGAASDFAGNLKADWTPFDIAFQACPSSDAVFPIQINSHWRVEFDNAQWILSRLLAGQWRARSFCVCKQALLRNVREHIGSIASEAVITLNSLPEWHEDPEVRP
jgi:hypothetical protein